MPTGQLKVLVVSAKDLPNKDEKGDPYVNVYIESGYVQKTQTIPGDLSPVWNESFTFQVEDGKHKLHLDVYDSDEGKKDDSLGITTIDLKDVFEKGKDEKTVDLSSSSLFFPKAQGKITVQLEFTKK
ncbi:30466_t:CDS:2 [Racocetra persica]|uniref:30466_t:CDS:1 n=1 Tax=Racocetra persica TaxID=160502 RepID=A0ACA9MDI6_9GLOM|nr:30466_t:CDS:2 [Racocetra persica]